MYFFLLPNDLDPWGLTEVVELVVMDLGGPKKQRFKYYDQFWMFLKAF